MTLSSARTNSNHQAGRLSSSATNGQLQQLIEKTPPHAIEAEVCLLGSIIVEPQRIPEIRNIMHSDDFSSPRNGTIYNAIVELYETHGSLDVVQLHQLLVDRDVLDAVGGQDYLVELANSMPSAANAQHYARLVREKAAVRGLLELAGNMFSRAHGTTSDPLSIIADTEAALQEIIQQSVSEPPRLTLGDDILDPADLDTQTIETGLRWFDGAMAFGAIHRGETVGLGAKPKVGKSALALQLCLSAIERSPNLRVLWCLGEMTLHQLQVRALANLSGLTIGLLRREDPDLTEQQAEAKQAAMSRLADLGQRMRILPAPFTPSMIERAVMADGAELCCVDYLQLVRPDRDHNTRREAVEETIREIVRIAKTHRLATLVISNLTKQTSDQGDMLTTWRESGEIGFALDCGYVGTIQDEEAAERSPDEPVHIEWKCLGNRNGPPRSFTVAFDRHVQRFYGVHHDVR